MSAVSRSTLLPYFSFTVFPPSPEAQSYNPEESLGNESPPQKAKADVNISSTPIVKLRKYEQWTPEMTWKLVELGLLKENDGKLSWSEIADIINTKFNTNKSPKGCQRYYNNYKNERR